LHNRLGVQLAQATGFTAETRPYNPHLTLGRVKNGVPARHLWQLGRAITQTQPDAGKPVTLNVTKIWLIKSQLKANGAVYSPLKAVWLGS